MPAGLRGGVAIPLPSATHSSVTVVVRVLLVALLVVGWSAPVDAQRWKSCPKGPDGKCQWPPCEPFLHDIQTLAMFRRKADDPRCPAQATWSARADQQQQKIDAIEASMSTDCIARAVPIMRRVASIDLRNVYSDGPDRVVAAVRYTNNTDRGVEAATIACFATRDERVVAKSAVVAGPIPKGATRDAKVSIDLGGESHACVECELTTER